METLTPITNLLPGGPGMDPSLLRTDGLIPALELAIGSLDGDDLGDALCAIEGYAEGLQRQSLLGRWRHLRLNSTQTFALKMMTVQARSKIARAIREGRAPTQRGMLAGQIMLSGITMERAIDAMENNCELTARV